MCKFFSCVSNGKGTVKFFDIKDIVEQMSIGNPKGYLCNRHTSICQFYGINSREEDLWNKWEYDPFKKHLSLDSRPLGVADDSPEVFKAMEKFFECKNLEYLQNLYNGNSGNWNSGNGNSGNGNSGDGNSGSRNSCDWNSGNRNSGNRNSGNRNSGSMNSGNRNSGDRNSGDWNSGDRNSGNMNSGNMNSGNRNSGNRNSGDWNSGDGNSGDGVLNSFCTKRQYMLFDKPCEEEEYSEVFNLPWTWFELDIWIPGGDMSEIEKKEHPYWEVTSGYIKHVDYKEAWKKCPKGFIEKVKKLKNFNAKKFEEISGLKV